MSTEQDPIIKWANANKKRIVKEYLSRYPYPSSDHPNIIFMAGIPGAGKTEFAKRLIPQLATPPLHIDMDEIAEHIDDYKPKIAHLFRGGATRILERLLDKAIDNKIDILMDGTFSHGKVLQNIERALNHGYAVRIYYISPSPSTAWQKTKDREMLEKRSIDPDGFVNAYFGLSNNLLSVQKTYGKTVPITVVIKNGDNRLKEINENVEDIAQYTDISLTRDDILSKMGVKNDKQNR